MNGKAAKLIRLYVAARAREGAPVVLRDVYRRYEAMTDDRRAEVKEFMRDYLEKAGVLGAADRQDLRRERPALIHQEGRRGGGILQWIAAMLGFTDKGDNANG